MASELTNCVIDIPSNIRARKMLIFRDPVTNVIEDERELVQSALRTLCAKRQEFTVIYLFTSCI